MCIIVICDSSVAYSTWFQVIDAQTHGKYAVSNFG
jgi:hypothetical protein